MIQPAMNTFYKHVIVDIPHVYMKTVVGKKGANLKTYCKQYKMNNIWFNMKRNLIEIWGPKESLNDVAGLIHKKITNVKKKIPKEELSNCIAQLSVSDDAFTCGSLEESISKENVKYLIGKNGINFKNITRLSNVSYIWYNDEKHSLDIWGPNENLQTAIGMLFSLITTVNNNILLKQTAVAESTEHLDTPIEASKFSYSEHDEDDMCLT